MEGEKDFGVSNKGKMAIKFTDMYLKNKNYFCIADYRLVNELIDIVAIPIEDHSLPFLFIRCRRSRLDLPEETYNQEIKLLSSLPQRDGIKYELWIWIDGKKEPTIIPATTN